MLRPNSETLETYLAEQVRDLRRRLREVERPSGEAKAAVVPRMGAAEQTIIAQGNELSAQAGHITSLGVRTTAAEAELGAQAGHIASLGVRASAAEARLAGAEAELGAQAGHITALGADLAAAQGSLTQLRQQVGTRPQGLTDPLWQELAKLIARVRALETNPN